MCTQSTTYTTTTSSTVGYTAMTSSGNEIHLTVKDAEMSNVDMVGLVHEISNSTYTSCNCLTGTNDWEIKASTWVGGLRANNNNFTLAIIDGTGNVLATQTAQTNGNITALTYLSVKATGLGTGPYYAVISYNKNSGSGDGFLNMHGWTLRIREDVPTTEAVVESNAFSFQPGYRYGFNGMVRDDEVKGLGNSYSTVDRLYDSRISRWLSTDPKEAMFPSTSPYAAMNNSPINQNDRNGDCTICDELEEAGIITDRGLLDDVLNTKQNVSHIKTTYDSKGGFSYIGELAGGSPPYLWVSEKQVTSTITYSEDRTKITISRTTVETVVQMGDYGPKAVKRTTTSESLTLGVEETGMGTVLIDYQIPLIDNVKETVSVDKKNRYKRQDYSRDLNKVVNAATEYNQGSVDRLGSAIQSIIMENSVKDNLEGYEPSEAPDPKKKLAK